MQKENVMALTLNQPQFGKWAVEIFLSQGFPDFRTPYIGSEKNLDITPYGVFSARYRPGTARFIKNELRQPRAREFGRREAIEYPVPCRAALLLPEHLPVHKPQRVRVFKILIEA